MITNKRLVDIGCSLITPVDFKVAVSGITDAWRNRFTVGEPSLFKNTYKPCRWIT